MPFHDQALSWVGARSWDDRVHFRLRFQSNHPENFGDWRLSGKGEFRMVPSSTDRIRPSRRGTMIEEVLYEDSANATWSNRGGPMSDYPFFFFNPHLGQAIEDKHVFPALFGYGRFSSDERLAFREMIEEEGMSSMEKLAIRKSKGALQVEVNAIEKIEFLWKKQRQVLDEYESLVKSGRLPREMTATLKRLLPQLRESTIERVFSL